MAITASNPPTIPSPPFAQSSHTATLCLAGALIEVETVAELKGASIAP